MTKIEEIEILSKKISEDIHEKLGYNDPLEKRHLNPFSHLKNFDFKDTVLVLGLNPSSADLDQNGESKDCFIHYYPYNGDSKEIKRIVRDFAKKGYTYSRYFKKPYELFWDKNYRPIWTNKRFLLSVKDRLEDEEYNLLNENEDTQKYCMFSDLIHYKEKTASKIEDIIINNEGLKKKVLQLFSLQIQFYNPKLVLINNAYASRLLTNFITNKSEVVTNIKFVNTVIIFSALLTGVRAIDNYSHERLKKEISEFLD